MGFWLDRKAKDWRADWQEADDALDAQEMHKAIREFGHARVLTLEKIDETVD